MNNISCTIAIPVYNREDLIRRAVESALAQDVPDLEILVVDNCSTDRTWDVLHTYSDSRLRLVRNESNIGLFGNFNCCLNLAHGQYLRFLCSDDALTPGTLKKEIAVMDAHPNVALLSTRGQRMDEDGRVLGSQADHFKEGIYPGLKAIYAILWFQAYYAYNPLNYPSGILLRRSAALQAGWFDVSMHMCGDVDFFLRVLEYGDLAVVKNTGCEITIHSDQQGVHLTGDVEIIREIILMTERYRSILEQAGYYSRIKKQLAAYAIVMAFKYWRMGLKEACHSYCETARRSGVPKTEVSVAVLRLLSCAYCLKQQEFVFYLFALLDF